MAFSETHKYIIAYDIADPKRLARLYRYMKTKAVPIQYSVFIAMLRHSQLQTLIADIAAIIHSGQDDVRIYPLPKTLAIISIGQNLLPADICLIENDTKLSICE
jgi:CRISPR-associated protein Cas2